MSRRSKNNDKLLRRSALSFDRGNGSLDVDHVLQSEPWKNIEKFEKSEAATIQKALNEIDDIITQVKSLEAKDHTTKKKASPRSTNKFSIKTPDSTTDLPGTSNTNNNVTKTKTPVNKKKKSSTKSQQASKMVEEIISQELMSCDIDNVKENTQKLSKIKIEKNTDSIKQIIKNETLQDITNVTEKDLQTSTPKIIKKKRRESTAEKSKTKNSENKSEDVQRKKRQSVSKKNTKNEQDDFLNDTNMLKEEKKTNVTSENSLESCAKRSDKCSSRTKEDIEKKRQHKKTIKAARAIGDLSRRITIVKKKMDCIKNDLESNESVNGNSEDLSESSYSTYSSSSYSSDSCSCTSDCSCSYCISDYSEYTNSSISSNSSESEY